MNRRVATEMVSPGVVKLRASLAEMGEAHVAAGFAITDALAQVHYRPITLPYPEDVTLDVINSMDEPELLHVRQYGINSPHIRQSLIRRLVKSYNAHGLPHKLHELVCTNDGTPYVVANANQLDALATLDMNFGFTITLPEDGTRAKALVNLRWLMTCFVTAVVSSWAPGSLRRNQSIVMVERYAADLRLTITPDEWEVFRAGLLDQHGKYIGEV